MKNKKGFKHALLAVMCMSVAATCGVGIWTAATHSAEGDYSYVARAEGEAGSETPATQNAYGGLDLTAGIKNATGKTEVDSADNTLIFTFPNENMAQGSSNVSGSADTNGWMDKIILHSTVEDTTNEYTVAEWLGKGKKFRFAVYGKCFIIMFENNSFGKGAEIDRITFKEGFKCFQGGSTPGEWVFPNHCDVAVESTAFTKDLTLYVNRTTQKYEYYAKSLTVSGTANKTSYEEGEAFDPTGLNLSVTTPLDETVAVPVTAEMCTYDFSAAGAKDVTISYGGATTTYAVTVTAPAKKPASIAVKEGGGLTAKRYALPSEFTIVEGTKLTVTYDDDTTNEVSFTRSMIKDAYDANSHAKAGVIDTSKAGEVQVPFTYTEGATTVEGTIKLTVSDELKPSNITGVKYGSDSEFSGGLGVDFNYTAGGDQGLKAIDGLKNLASLIPEKTLGDLVLIKFANQAEPIPMNDSGIAPITPAFYAGKFCIRDTGNVNSETYGIIEYIVIKEGFVWYGAPADHWGAGNGIDTAANGYYPVATNYVSQDLYIGVSNKKLVKPVKNFTVTVEEGKTLELLPEHKPTAEELEGITYSAQWLDPNETEAAPSGNVTPAMCSAAPSEGGPGQIIVTLNGAKATFDVTVLDVSMPASIEVVAKDETKDFAIMYKKYAVEPEFINCELRVTYEDGSTEDVELKPEYITAWPNTRKEYTDAEDKPLDTGEATVTIKFTQYGKTVANENVAVKIDQKNVVASNIESVAYGKYSKDNDTIKNFYVVYFNWKNGGDQGLKALDAIHKLPSSAHGKQNGQFIKIKFANQAEPIALLNGKNKEQIPALQPAFYGGAFVLREVDKLGAEYGEIEYIIFEKGVVWYTAEKDTWGSGNSVSTSGYRPIPTNIFTQKMYAAWDAEDKLTRPVASIEAVPAEGYKTEYLNGELLSLDFELNVTYVDGEVVTITPTREMCGEIKDGKAVITYGSKTCEIMGLTYDTEHELGELVIKTTGKTQYSFGDVKFDPSGYVVKLQILNASDHQTVAEEREIALSDLEISGFDGNTIGTHTMTFTYAGKSTTVDITVVNDKPEAHMTVDYLGNYNSYETTKLRGISIHFGFTSEVGKVTTKAFLYADKLPNVADKIKVNDKLVSEWMATGEIEYIGFYADELYLRFVTNRLQPTTSTVEFGSYEEDTTELVKTVTLLPGFQYYYTTEDFWGNNNWTADDVHAVAHGMIKETIILENMDDGTGTYGKGWMRQFKLNSEGTGMADDAITIKSLPSKREFTVGEDITTDALADGLELHFKYQDGAEEDYIPGPFDLQIDGDLTTAGKKTVYVYFKDINHYTTFEIDVKAAAAAPAEEEEDSGCGSSVGVAGMAAASVAALGGAVAIAAVARKKKRNNK